VIGGGTEVTQRRRRVVSMAKKILLQKSETIYCSFVLVIRLDDTTLYALVKRFKTRKKPQN
jgi:hypothetical protein